MKIRARPIQHLPDEFQMGQVLFFVPLADCDGISVTANPGGFTTMNRVVNALGVNLEEAEDLIAVANTSGHIQMLTVGHRKLFLVPRTKESQAVARLTDELLSLAARESIRVLELTHFNFILGDFPAHDITVILEAMHRIRQMECPADVVFDIDSRFLQRLATMLEQFQGDRAAASMPGSAAMPPRPGNKKRT